jgi:hypothetical protein
MTHTPGQIAEYGTSEFKENQSIYTILESGIYTNPHGIQFKTELYHRSEGYKLAGSCAIWTNEVWGYKFFEHDGSTTGKFSSNKEEIINHWQNLINKSIVTLTQVKG